MSQRPALAAARGRLFPDTAPASTAVEVRALAVGGWLVEIGAIAIATR